MRQTIASRPRPRPGPVPVTPADVDLLRHAMWQLARADADRARDLNGMGFSKYDSPFGHSLATQAAPWSWRQTVCAARLLRRYRRQLEPDIITTADRVLRAEDAFTHQEVSS